MGNIDNGGNYVGLEVYGKSLQLPLNFAVNLKLLEMYMCVCMHVIRLVVSDSLQPHGL